MSDAKIMKTLNGYTVYDEAAHREIETLKGAAPGLVFDTVTDMEAYVAEHSAELRIGQDLYIRQADVPDYWWDGTQAIPVETDMTEIRKEMENLSEAIANLGGGMNATAKTLLITILRNGVYTSDQSANITALENALNESGGDDDTEGGVTQTGSALYITGGVTAIQSGTALKIA